AELEHALEQGGADGAAAVRMELDEILARIGARRRKREQQASIERRAGRVAEGAEQSAAWPRFPPGENPRDRERGGPRDANDRDRTFAGRSGDGGDRRAAA